MQHAGNAGIVESLDGLARKPGNLAPFTKMGHKAVC